LQAQSMARHVVGRKLAACAQISEIQSVYTWNGALQDEKEFRILFKSTRAAYPALEAAIRELHAYELPAIHALAFDHVSAPYAAWIDSQVAL
ncbi:MAG: divalent-cation tolerance protein CutA, partial [Burkholderiaceae bacterium]